MKLTIPGLVLTSIGALALPVALAACPGPKMPSGPPPEYEQPPPPSWLGDAAAAPGEPAAPAPEHDGGLPSS